MEGLKLLFVINHIDWFWTHRLPLAQGAQKKGWNVSVAVTGAKNDANLSKAGFTGYDLPDSQKGFMPLTLLKILLGIYAVLKKDKPDVLHVITLKYAFLGGLAALVHPRVRIVHTIAGLGYLFSGEGTKPKILRMMVGPLLKLALKRKNTALIFQNPDDMSLMMQRGFARFDQCHLIRGSGVDLTQFQQKPVPVGDTPIVLMPTRLVHDKGIHIFIDAAKIVQHKNPNIRFQIAGGTSQSNPLAIKEEEMKDMLQGSNVEWLGKVSDMPALYEQTTLICYPSYYGEGIPKVLLEASATGRPIITTDHAGCREVVEPEINGKLVPVKDAQATANAILELLAHAEHLSLMGNASRQKAEAEFDVNLIVEQTLQVYKT